MKTLHTRIYGEKAELLLLFCLHLIQQHPHSYCPYSGNDSIRLNQLNYFYINDREVQWIDLLPVAFNIGGSTKEQNILNILEANGIYRNELNEVCMMYYDDSSMSDNRINEKDILSGFLNYSCKILTNIDIKENKPFTLRHKAHIYFSNMLYIEDPRSIADIAFTFTKQDFTDAVIKFKNIIRGVEDSQQLFDAPWSNQFLIEERKLMLAEKRERVEKFYNACFKNNNAYTNEIKELKNKRENEIIEMFK